MALHREELPWEILTQLRQGVVIPAHPLALTEARQLDERHQRALTRYYLDAGAGGLAVGVHTTQFEIRDVGLFEPVLRLAAETAAAWAGGTLIMIAGLVGSTQQALAEADIALGLGYHAGLLSLAAHKGADEDALIAHCEAVAGRIPLIGFYLQPAVGGIVLSAEFWRRFAAIDNVIAIKVAPFNRYRTLDVVRGVVAAEAEDRISLYTGNDDHILMDLITPFAVRRGDETVVVRFRGGLLGHWSVWVKPAVEYLAQAHAAVVAGEVDVELLQLDSQITDANSVLFDVVNDFVGCIAGCHEVLRRQGLLQGNWCLNPDEAMSPGQAEELDRVMADYPHLCDDEFVAANLLRWLD
ncbi:MAG: dihydrodipicolinate synthase family protein [Alphaproteobacteria bacterium]|jgi:dihydrodipicolinate synthase/N-acetylneuraminate lyase|nr:dihydrodipicolinate synthase family protein [Alphaproteobacteria bacterium]